MANKISLILTGAGGYRDMSQLVENLQWKGRKGASARTLSGTLIDDPGYLHARSGIDIESGNQCVFTLNGQELFRGLITQQTQGRDKRLKFTAHDNGIYLANNKDTFVYQNKTASDVFSDCCSRFGLPVGAVASCGYVIPELIKSKTTAFDAIMDALAMDYAATGVRHYVASDGGNLSLLERRDHIVTWVIKIGENVINYTYSKDISSIKTRVKAVTKEGTVIAQQSDGALESKIGIFQEVEQPDESLTEPQLNDLISGMLADLSMPKKTLSVEAMGKTDVISGVCVYIMIPEIDLSRAFYVDEDTHTFKDNLHTMTLKLNHANDVEDKARAAKMQNSTGNADDSDDNKNKYVVGDGWVVHDPSKFTKV